MANEIIEYVCAISRLAAELNPKSTRRELTGNKPTVFVDFSGHVNKISIRVYLKGWSEDEPYCDKYNTYGIYLNDDLDVVISQLAEAVEMLNKLVKEWSNRNE